MYFMQFVQIIFIRLKQTQLDKKAIIWLTEYYKQYIKARQINIKIILRQLNTQKQMSRTVNLNLNKNQFKPQKNNKNYHQQKRKSIDFQERENSNLNDEFQRNSQTLMTNDRVSGERNSNSFRNSLMKTMDPQIQYKYRSTQRQKPSLSIFKQRQRDPPSSLAQTRRIYMQKIADESFNSIINQHQPQLQGQLTKRRTRIFQNQSSKNKQDKNNKNNQPSPSFQTSLKQTKKQSSEINLLPNKNIFLKEKQLPQVDVKVIETFKDYPQKIQDNKVKLQFNSNKDRNLTINVDNQIVNIKKQQNISNQISLSELEEEDSDLPTPQQLLNIITHMNNKNKMRNNQNRAIVVNNHRSNHHQLYKHYQIQSQLPFPSFQLQSNSFPTIIPILPATHYENSSHE